MQNNSKENSNLKRCQWCIGDSLYEKYHDEEWGVPVYDDQKLFEFIVLETFQAGLNWLTILKKRENFREAFEGFSIDNVATFSEEKVQELMTNSGIIRNKLKIQSAISNAKAFLQIQNEYGSFKAYIWEFVGNSPIQNNWENHSDIPSSTPLSEKISKDLKKHNFKFVGPTTIYAFMQAIGMVNDHITTCYRYDELSS